MRFLIDANLSRRLAHALQQAGHNAESLIDRGLHGLDDEAVLELARAEQRVLISADTDFGALLVRQHAATPSIVLLRRSSHRRPERVAMLILSNLEQLRRHLDDGCIAVFQDEALRIRALPIEK